MIVRHYEVITAIWAELVGSLVFNDISHVCVIDVSCFVIKLNPTPASISEVFTIDATYHPPFGRSIADILAVHFYSFEFTLTEPAGILKVFSIETQLLILGILQLEIIAATARCKPSTSQDNLVLNCRQTDFIIILNMFLREPLVSSGWSYSQILREENASISPVN